ncbi:MULTISPECIES: hypothetical protein [unclassified Nocardiopsis]|uniref:hypothetical protein n=1 Tax=unclassified Nocardiopsis TaxID=2649073 RepID=UPI003402710B
MGEPQRRAQDAPEPGIVGTGDGESVPLPEVGGLVVLGSEDAPACSDGICW